LKNNFGREIIACATVLEMATNSRPTRSPIFLTSLTSRCIRRRMSIISQRAKAAVRVPIIGSLNGSTFGGWQRYAQQIQQAGADALELNIYAVPTDPDRSAGDIETDYLTIVASVKGLLKISVAIELSPFFTNFSQFARRLDSQGANALVLFNRFYQPDIELETLEVSPNLLLSAPMEMRLPMRWIALLYGRIGANLAATSGIHHGVDALKMLMAPQASPKSRRNIRYLRIPREIARNCEDTGSG